MIRISESESFIDKLRHTVVQSVFKCPDGNLLCHN